MLNLDIDTIIQILRRQCCLSITSSMIREGQLPGWQWRPLYCWCRRWTFGWKLDHCVIYSVYYTHFEIQYHQHINVDLVGQHHLVGVVSWGFGCAVVMGPHAFWVIDYDHTDDISSSYMKMLLRSNMTMNMTIMIKGGLARGVQQRLSSKRVGWSEDQRQWRSFLLFRWFKLMKWLNDH